MDLLTKIVKTLPERHYETLLEKVGGGLHSNNYKALKILRTEAPESDALSTELNLGKGAFNTFKSRLLKKVSSQLSKLEENTISLLKEETARLNQLVLQNEKDVSIRMLQEMEKKLIEYDLSSELADVYKNLARLHRFHEEYEQYEMLYKKHIAFSLAVTKAEDLLYDFIYYLSHYHLQKEPELFAKLESHLAELENICHLYQSHRLNVIYNIARIYYNCSFLEPQKLALLEIEIEEKLAGFSRIFDKYEQDAFYQNIKHIVPFLFFEFYARVGNVVKANHYMQKINLNIDRVAHLQLWPFFITQMINVVVSKFITDGDRGLIFDMEDRLSKYYFPNPNEAPHFICYYRFLAMIAFYRGQYAKAAKVINDLRNSLSLKQFPLTEVEMKLFQAFQYALLNDNELAERLLASAKRHVLEDEELKPLVKLLSKVLVLIMKHRQDGGEKERIISSWNKFKARNNGKLLHFIRLSLIEI